MVPTSARAQRQPIVWRVSTYGTIAARKRFIASAIIRNALKHILHLRQSRGAVLELEVQLKVTLKSTSQARVSMCMSFI